ncbi:hypothetical protein BJF78_19235 [Pseudonocardia sp. CNS-139]|nr:hypothetical protein BJF78_19235 [Pseudonocardia sp. CNS-139]
MAHQLPRLTILYYCAMDLLGRKEFRVVSRMDFYFLLSNAHHGLGWDEVERLRAWLDREIRRRRGTPQDEHLPARVPAAELLAAVEKLDVRAGMIDAKDEVVARLGEPAPVDREFDPFSDGFGADPHGTRPADDVAYSPGLDRWVVSSRHGRRDPGGSATGAVFVPGEARRRSSPLWRRAVEALAGR